MKIKNEIKKAFIFIFICIGIFISGYVTGVFNRPGNGKPSTDESNSYSIDRIVELTREYLVTERKQLADERNNLDRLAESIDTERKQLERERVIASSDRKGLAELERLIEETIQIVENRKSNFNRDDDSNSD